MLQKELIEATVQRQLRQQQQQQHGGKEESKGDAKREAKAGADHSDSEGSDTDEGVDGKRSGAGAGHSQAVTPGKPQRDRDREPRGQVSLSVFTEVVESLAPVLRSSIACPTVVADIG